jgi:hypothetical protein
MRNFMRRAAITGATVALGLVSFAGPALADDYGDHDKSPSNSKCNAGGGNGSEYVWTKYGKKECDPGNSGNTPAADND